MFPWHLPHAQCHPPLMPSGPLSLSPIAHRLLGPWTLPGHWLLTGHLHAPECLPPALPLHALGSVSAGATHSVNLCSLTNKHRCPRILSLPRSLLLNLPSLLAHSHTLQPGPPAPRPPLLSAPPSTLTPHISPGTLSRHLHLPLAHISSLSECPRIRLLHPIPSCHHPELSPYLSFPKTLISRLQRLLRAPKPRCPSRAPTPGGGGGNRL